MVPFLWSGELPRTKSFTNSIGMKLVKIEPGDFLMGESNTPIPDHLTASLSYPTRNNLKKKFPYGDPDRFIVTLDHVKNGDYDEQPVHKVKISQPFYMGIFEVTNAQYEQFDPAHHHFRGKNGFSKDDDDAVVFVNWKEVKAFCDWLSKKEGLPYRLLTEAEWEYACRAGKTTLYFTGDSLPKTFQKNATRTSFTEPEDIVNLVVGKTPANPWGLFDMHGNVEEWCFDWYGSYEAIEQVDPVGRVSGDFKVARGGSHGTNLYYLRSANRMGTLPENKNWMIGFRVVLGRLPSTEPLPQLSPQLYQQEVKQEIPKALRKIINPKIPYFKGPRQYVKIARGEHGPLYAHHNHDPAITNCPNGDLLAIWYTCVEERGRELAIAASRLRYGEEKWEPASLFWDVPDRNDHCPALWFDGKNTIYHFNGLCVAGKWEPLAIIMRTSKDNGANWSKARLIVPEHGYRQMVGEPVFRTHDGVLVFGADAQGGSTIWVSRDNGQTWSDPGGNINGIHAGIVELKDGRLLALDRGQNINGWMPMSISRDMGKTWQSCASIFPPITGGQRAALIRLKEGPPFFASFADDINNYKPVPNGVRPPRHISSIFGAISYDDGKTWPVRRIISDGESDHQILTIDGTPIRMSKNTSEPQGYLSFCQGLDGIIHLISSQNHYAFNLAWLQQKQSESSSSPEVKILPMRKKLEKIYDAKHLPVEEDPLWNFLSGQFKENEVSKILRSGVIQIESDSIVYWSNERTGQSDDLDAQSGFTVEFSVQVSGNLDNNRGFDFGVYARGGALTSNYYLISISATTIQYWYDKKFIRIAENIDNFSAFHTYRLAVRDDTAVQIYRDEQLISVQPPDLVISWTQPARGSYIRWGNGAEGIRTLLDYIACDINGPFQSGE